MGRILSAIRNFAQINLTPSPSRYVTAAPTDENENNVFLFKVAYRDGRVRYSESTVTGNATHEVVTDLMSYDDVQEVTIFKFHGKITKAKADSTTDGLVGPAIVALASMR